MKNHTLMALGLFSLVSIACAAPAHKAVKSRGQRLFDKYCLHCHVDIVHSRATSKIDNLGDLAHEVKKWAGIQRMKWNQEELRDVADYMNRKYYKLKK